MSLQEECYELEETTLIDDFYIKTTIQNAMSILDKYTKSDSNYQ